MASFSACPQLAKFFAEPTTDTPGRVLDWPCFSPGYHKGRQYTAEDIAKIVRNFNLLHGAMYEGYGQKPSMNYPCIRCDKCSLVVTFGERTTHKMVERWNKFAAAGR